MSAKAPRVSLDLEALKRLADAATRGPWRWEIDGDPRGWIASVTGETGDIVCDPPPDDCERSRQVWLQNAAYIAAIDPETLKALIARVEAAEAALREGQTERDAGEKAPSSWAPSREARPW